MTDLAENGSKLGRLSKSGIGIIAIYVALAVIAFALMWFPSTGIFLMFFGGFFIIGVLLHLMLIHLGLASLLRVINPAWLALPLIFYGGGFGLHLVSVHEAASAASLINEANMKQQAPTLKSLSYSSKDFAALQLIESFRANAFYSWRPRDVYLKYYYAKEDACANAFQFSLNGQIAARQRAEYAALPAPKPFMIIPDLFSTYHGADKTRQCILAESSPGANGSSVNIELGPDQEFPPSRMFRACLTDWTATDTKSHAVLANVRVGPFEPLPAIQNVIAGCGLVDGPGPGWRCEASLSFEPLNVMGTGPGAIVAGYQPDGLTLLWATMPTEPEKSPAAAMAHALGLAPRTPTD